MIKFVALACFVVCAQASLIAAPAALSTGTSTSSRTQDAAGNYAFAYNEQHATGGSSRAESGNGWATQGSYSLNVGDGRQRIVKYIADGAGFRAAISTNEPGTAALPAASTAIASPYAPPQPVQPLPVPVVAAPAPVAVAAPLAFNGWNDAPIAAAPLAAPALPALAAPAPIAYAHPAPIAAPIAIAPVIKAVPAVSSYSTSINHVAPAPVVAVAAPALAIPSIPALAAPAPIVQAPLALNGWN